MHSVIKLVYSIRSPLFRVQVSRETDGRNDTTLNEIRFGRGQNKQNEQINREVKLRKTKQK